MADPQIEKLRADLAYRSAELVIAGKRIELLERRLANADRCPWDNRPCFVSRGTEDEHFRCGTCQCGRNISQLTNQDTDNA